MKNNLMSKCGNYSVKRNEQTGRYDVHVCDVFAYSDVNQSNCVKFCGRAEMIPEEEKRRLDAIKAQEVAALKEKREAEEAALKSESVEQMAMWRIRRIL